MIIDASNLLLGRMATYIAKQALLGEKIDIINCEQALISGKKSMVISKYKKKKAQGEHGHGPFFNSMPDRLVRRTIRGMLPYKTSRGKEAYKRVMCYIGVPDEFKESKILSIPEANHDKLPILSTVRIGYICSQIGGKYDKANS